MGSFGNFPLGGSGDRLYWRGSLYDSGARQRRMAGADGKKRPWQTRAGRRLVRYEIGLGGLVGRLVGVAPVDQKCRAGAEPPPAQAPGPVWDAFRST